MKKEKFDLCLKRIHDGDNNGLKPIYDEYYEKLAVTAGYYLHDEQLGRDAASNVMLKILQYAKTHEDPDIKNVGAYMNTAIKNAALDIYKANKPYDLSYEEVEEVAACRDKDESDRVTVKIILESFPETEFKIATMYYFYDFRVREIARELDMPIGTVKWKLSAIRKHLLKELARK